MMGKVAFELAVHRFTDFYWWDKIAWNGRDKPGYIQETGMMPEGKVVRRKSNHISLLVR